VDRIVTHKKDRLVPMEELAIFKFDEELALEEIITQAESLKGGRYSSS
jgi:hypothetical protein